MWKQRHDSEFESGILLNEVVGVFDRKDAPPE